MLKHYGSIFGAIFLLVTLVACTDQPLRPTVKSPTPTIDREAVSKALTTLPTEALKWPTEMLTVYPSLPTPPPEDELTPTAELTPTHEAETIKPTPDRVATALAETNSLSPTLETSSQPTPDMIATVLARVTAYATTPEAENPTATSFSITLPPTKTTLKSETHSKTPISAPDVAIEAPVPISIRVPETFKAPKTGGFAKFVASKVQQTANISATEIAPDLGNVEISMLLSREQRNRLTHNGFAVSPGENKEFYELYEKARYDYIPIFVTSDSLLHVYHLLFDKVLRSAESSSFVPMLTKLDWELLNTSIKQYDTLENTPWAEAARRNAAYFAVAVKILMPEWEIPNGLRDLTTPDLQQIETHKGLGPSAIFPAYREGEDWSQYVPRGHYTQSEALQRYFKAMMWHGRMTFRVNDATETQQAALLTLALQQTVVDSKPAQAIWAGIYEPTVFFVGRSDDLMPLEYNPALEKAYGSVKNAKELVDDKRFAAFQTAIEALRPPEVLGMVINRNDPDVEKITKGLRFMGQRLVPDAFVFRQLIDRNVPKRMLPKALDFFAALGSDRALSHLEATGDTAMPNYQTNMLKLRTTIKGYDEQVWTQNLYWAWIHSLRPLLEPVGNGYPQFMRNSAWLDKQLNTALGSWTELKRDTILYAKQVYAERGAGALPPPNPEPPKGYVEPVPLLFARIAALSQMTIDGLDSRGLLSESDKKALAKMAEIAQKLQTIAEKELRSELLTEAEYEFIRFYGADIEGLTFAASDEADYQGSGGTAAGGDTLQAAVVADVATDPNGQVLEEGVGRIFDLYVVVPIGDHLIVTKGGVFSHYEFAQPLAERLTDADWRNLLDQGKAPPLASWVRNFIVDDKVTTGPASAIREFNHALVEATWYGDAERVARFLGKAEFEDTRKYIQGLKDKGHFIGSKLFDLNYRSFDFQGSDHVVVTTRERWFDELYTGSPEYSKEMSKVSERGPYELNATYTLDYQVAEKQWLITKIVVSPDPPKWKTP